MNYRVTVHGRAFEVEVKEGDQGLLARVLPGAPAKSDGKTDESASPPPFEPVALSARQGSLAALVTERGRRTVTVERTVEDGVYEVALPGGRALRCEVEDERTRLARANRAEHGGEASGPRTVRAVMPGIVVKILVEPGSVVGEKDAILVVEAMKMQNEIRAGVAGTVTKLHVRTGQSVAAGNPLVELAAAP